MAQAKKVKPGQVWTAKVSGKPTQVEIVGETTASAGGRTRFLWKNLNTGRTSAGGAGKLHDLVREGAAPLPIHSAPVSAPAPAPRRPAPPRAPHAPQTITPETVARGSFPFQRRNPTPAQAPPRLPVEDRSYYVMREQLHAPSVPTSLPSLRSPKPPVSSAPARSNPKHYPSPAARSAAEAISRSGAQSPQDVLAVVQSWAYSFGPPQVAPPYGYPAPPSFNPYGQPRQY